MRICYLALLLGLFSGELKAQSAWVLREVRIVAPAENQVSDPMDIFIRDGKIVTIHPTVTADLLAEPGTIVEGQGGFVMAGMIDGHMHHFQSGGLYTRPDALDLRGVKSYAQELAETWADLPDMWARYLKAGITQICDVGGPNRNFELMAQADATPRPDVSIAGPLISSYQPAALRTDDPPILLIRDPAAARAEVERQAAFKPAFIKIWYIVLPGQTPETYLPVVEAVVESSHAHQIPVAVHATQLETARLAIQAGADMLVHSVDDQVVDTAFISLLKRNNISYIPTLQVSGNYGLAFVGQPQLGLGELAFGDPAVIATLTDSRHLKRDALPQWTQNRLAAPLRPSPADSIRAENLRLLQASGVRIVAGTDAGNIGTLHAGSYLRELQLMEAAGMSRSQVLQAATVAGAEMLGQPNWGQVAEGMDADLVLLPANPLDDLSVLAQPRLVVKAGQYYRPAELVPDTDPVAMAQRQLNAYNARNIEAFAACYAPDVRVYQGHDKLLYTGRETLFQRYLGFFQATEALHCELVNRIHIGETVVDQERVSGLPGGEIIEAIAVYTIKGGLIHEVHFFQP